jgi:ATP-dependent protease ClpP protease subunit
LNFGAFKRPPKSPWRGTKAKVERQKYMEIRYSKIVGRNIQEATVEIYGSIGEKVQGDYLATEINYQDKNVDNMVFRINSMGGSFIQGLSIISAITGAKSKTTAIIEGIAGSMAGFIALACTHVAMNDFARLMLHAPYYRDDENNKVNVLTPEEQTALASLKGIVVDLLTRRGKSKKEITAILEKDTWYTAEEALAEGFIDEIIDTGVAKAAAGLSIEKIAALATAEFVEKKFINTNTDTMKKIAAKLGLPETADELAIVAALDQKDTNVAAATTKLIDSVIAAGRKSGTVTDKNEANMRKLAKADLDLCIDLVMKPAEAADNTRLSDVIAKINEAFEKKEVKDEKNWDWYQKNDVVALQEMKITDKTRYAKLYKEYWGKELVD